MTKVEAIKRVLKDNGGVAVWNIIYNQIEKYHPKAKQANEWKAGIRGVLYRDLGKSFKMIDVGVIALIDYDENRLLLAENNNNPTSKSILTNIRLGQEKFRKNLLKYLTVCPITGINDKRILVASHIKPWAMSNNEERLDVNNGFIFSPNIDILFDRGLISFEDDKEILISPSLTQFNIQKIGIKHGEKYKKLPLENREKYLDYHRSNIFISSQ